jgi:adenylate kinase
MFKGKLIILEGCDGFGGETQIKLLKEKFPNALFLGYPDYNNKIGLLIHDFLHNKIDLNKDVQFLLFATDMIKDSEKIRNALEKGRYVFVDRYIISTIVYQGVQGFDEKKALEFIKLFDMPEPDIVFLLSISPETSLKRKMKEKGSNVDKWESDLEFQRKVAKKYEEVYKSKIFGKKWILIDGEKSINEVHENILNEIYKDAIGDLNIIILGQQGSGKGAYSQYLKERFGLAHISTGDLLREEIKNETEIGKMVKDFVNSGKLVPDDIVTDVLENELKKIKNGFILDGYPRTINQANLLESLLSKIGRNLDVVINLCLPDEISIERITNRRICRNCGQVYNLKNMPSKIQGVCDKCGGELYQREDDKEEIVKKRLEEYHKLIDPIIEHYRQKNLLREVNSGREFNIVINDIENLLKNIVIEKLERQKMKTIIILGPPGSGKGTISKEISERLNFEHIETGKILREEIEKNTEIGKKVKEIVSSGRLVPDDIVNNIIKEKLFQTRKKGIIFDGYPRTVGQAEYLKKILKIDLIINLNLPEKILIKRIMGRRTCKKCGEVYNVADINEVIDGRLYIMKPLLPKIPGICDKCGGELYQREDENPETIKQRLIEYEKQTKPLIDYYKNERFVELYVTSGKDEMVESAIKIIKEALRI